VRYKSRGRSLLAAIAISIYPTQYSDILFVFVNYVEFPTSEAELGVVYSLFDSHKLGRIYYKEFVDTVMRPDRQVIHFFLSRDPDHAAYFQSLI